MSATSASRAAKRSGGRLRGPLISLAVLVVFALLGEGVVRVGGWAGQPLDVLRLAGLPNRGESPTLWDRDLLYTLRPDTLMFDAYRINGLGYRGPEVDPVKPPDTLRIVCTGDSSTFGMGVADEETWPARLASMLQVLLEGARHVEVVNAAVPGYSTEQNRRQVERDLLALQPDVLIVCPTAQNDLRWQVNAGDAAALDGNTRWRRFLDQSHLLRLVRGGGLRDAFHVSGRRDPDTPGARPRVTPAEFEANLQRISALAHEHDVLPVLLVTEHSEWREAIDPAIDASEDTVVRVAGEAGALVADAREAFAGYAPYPLFSDGIHFTELGQQLVANAALRAMLQHAERLAGAGRAGALADWSAGLDDPAMAEPGRAVGADGVPRLRELFERDAAGSLAAFNRELGVTTRPIDPRLAAAIDLSRRGQYFDALPLFEAALADAPADVEALFEYGMALRRAGRRDEGTELFRRAAQADPEGAIGRFLVGLLAFEAGDVETAEPALRDAIAQQSTLGLARFTLGRLLLQKGELHEAEKQLRMSVLMRTESDAAAALLGEIEARRAKG